MRWWCLGGAVVAGVGCAASGGTPLEHAIEPRPTLEEELLLLPDVESPVDSEPPAELAPTPRPAPPTVSCDEPSIPAAIAPREDGAADGAVSYDDDAFQFVIGATIGGTAVSLRIDDFALSQVRSHGEAVDADVVAVGRGAALLVHHNLDRSVDPPRFFRSRWSELWWIPPDFVSGECMQPIEVEGTQHQTAWATDDGVCLADALGTTQHFKAEGGTLVRTDAECSRRAAPQHDWSIPSKEALQTWVERGAPEPLTYLEVGRVRRLRPLPRLTVFAVDAVWSSPASFEEGEPVDQYPATRLVVFDDRGAAPEVSWHYAAIGNHCHAKRRGTAIACGRRRFRFTPAGVVVVSGH